ncbi:hypothetical protein SF06_00480 [Pseudomonas flexibilis]|nr:hypothetical protein SF06_00480 [Pseudomonas flexibilis]
MVQTCFHRGISPGGPHREGTLLSKSITWRSVSAPLDRDRND